MPVYIPELTFVPDFHTGTYEYILYPCTFFYIFLTVYPFSLLRSIPARLIFPFLALE
jgi:hypothetical protein